MNRRGLRGFLTGSVFFFFSGIFLISGCAVPAKTLDKSIKGPQVIVNPEKIRLGIATLKDTKIVFSGSGFEPRDSVLIELLDVPLDEEEVNIPVATAHIDKDGTFEAQVGAVTKFSEFIRAKIDPIENVLIVTRPPMPEGTYTALATSLISDKRAECALNVEGPSLLDSFKDWIGVLLGKIVKK